MKLLIFLISLLSVCISGISHAKSTTESREIVDFNFNWQFHLGEVESAFLPNSTSADSHGWSTVKVPHDWSASLPYSQTKGASSTGFKAGGIGWYRKTFELEKADLSKAIWLEFDGIYNNSQIWVNGHFAGHRPNGYSSFAINLSEYAVAGKNLVSVRVDRTAYNDARWYTGSGIYRDVRLVKTSRNHIAHWGVQILTPKVNKKQATVTINSQLTINPNNSKPMYLDINLLDQSGEIVAKSSEKVTAKGKVSIDSKLTVKRPQLWQLDAPKLYSAQVILRDQRKQLDISKHTFGIRNIEFDTNKGFLLNGMQTKIKGVNLHHDAGVIGAAVPKEIWRYRLEKLQSIGTNAIRLSHNPHSPDLLDLADEMGFLVMVEMFDDWLKAKDKSVVFLSDNAGKGDDVKSYTEHFSQWAETDLTDLIKRDYNHPSVIMWSIGNEIEWTYPYYQKSLVYSPGDSDYHKTPPLYDAEKIKAKFDKNKGTEPDQLALTAQYLSNIVKKLDTSRPVTAGLVIPSVSYVSGYTDALDVVGLNYRAKEYDIAHKTYPNKPIIGSENWGTWPEWQAVLEREFVPGIFVWTGFAYKGEAGPWPRKGLEISFFDYAGNKTPRGHQFETFWLDKPKVYLATIEAEKSEYQFDADKGWQFTERKHPNKRMQWLRKWEWFNVSETWNYPANQEVMVHVYSNTEESELFLNGKSLGKQKLSDENDRILFWQVPYNAGELKVVGYNQGVKQAEYSLNTHSQVASIRLTPTKTALLADQYDVSHVHVQLLDKAGNLVNSKNHKVNFELSGAGTLLAVDNGWEMNVDNSRDSVDSPQGKAMALIQSTDKAGVITVKVNLDNGMSNTIQLTSQRTK
ncbi:sugar-binding domain-containing protein [Paraglaciecola sp. L3A3]|uniref:sugar-binding domain-containing protein n=1 Tax=Paraglaciecola sp. L3A3 TaxID=2686358 RepID=UPI00131E0EAC|nr:sugar-binding domain-containing protein [Paraglaciecola sp. L3A3]